MPSEEKKPRTIFGEVAEEAKKIKDWAEVLIFFLGILTFTSSFNPIVRYFSLAFVWGAVVWYLWPKRRQWRSKTNRLIASIGILMTTVLTIGLIVVTALGFLFLPAGPGELLVIVSQFDQRGGAGLDPKTRILDALRTEFKNAGLNNVRIEVAPVIHDEDEARRIGEVHRAVFVIWGWYDSAGFSPYFTITQPGNLLFPEKISEVPTEQRDFSLYIREELPTQMSYFSTFTLGQLYYWQGKNVEALKSFDIALSIVKNLPPLENESILYRFRGDVYSDLNQWDQSTSEYTNGIQLDPKDDAAYNNRGFAYQHQGNLDQAIADYSTAIELNPTIAVFYCNRGYTYQYEGNLDQAIADYNKAIELDPKYVSAYNNRGLAYKDKGNLNQAIADYSKAIELDMLDAVAYDNRGAAYQTKGNLEQAIVDYNKAIDLNPKGVYAYINRGSAYQAKGDLDQAISDYGKAIELDPKFAEAYYYRGNANRQKGFRPDASKDFEMYLQLSPNAVDRAQVEQWIRVLKGQ